jgi:DNA polymerase III epsilon subunit-like protein
MNNNAVDPPTPPTLVPLHSPAQALKITRRISFIDLEMSGGNSDRHMILQAGGVLTDFPSLATLRSFERKIWPATLKGCQWQAVRVSGFKWSVWKKEAVGIYVAMKVLRDFVAGAIIAGWDLSQDLKFIDSACLRTKSPAPKPIAFLDVQHWAQDRLNLPHRPSLQAVCDMLHIPRPKHDALIDSRATYQVFRLFWQYGPDELPAVLRMLAEGRPMLSNPIRLKPEDLIARKQEILKYITTDPTVFMRHERACPDCQDTEDHSNHA